MYHHTLGALKHLREVGPFDEVLGICNNINYRKFPGADLDDLQEAFKTWEKFSGDVSYPVPAPNGDMSAQGAFNSYINVWEGRYGALRYELLDHCIEYFQNKVYQQ